MTEQETIPTAGETPATPEVPAETPPVVVEVKQERTAKDHIIERKQSQINKSNEQASEWEQKYNESQEQLKAFKGEKNPYEDVEQRINEFSRTQGIDQFVKDNPDFSKYSSVVKELSGQTSLKTDSLFYAVAGKDLMNMGVEKYKASLKEAKQGAGATTTATASGNGQDWGKASAKDFRAMYDKMSRI